MSAEVPAFSGPTIASTPAPSAEGLSSATFSAAEVSSPSTISLTKVTIAYSPEMDAGTVVAESPVEIAPAAVLQMPIYQPGVFSQAEISADDSARLAAARAELSQLGAPEGQDLGENITREVVQSSDNTLSQTEEGNGVSSENFVQSQGQDTAVAEDKGDLSDSPGEENTESVDNPKNEKSDVDGEKELAEKDPNTHQEGEDDVTQEADESSDEDGENTDEEEQTDENTEELENEENPDDPTEEDEEDEQQEPPPDDQQLQPVISSKIGARIDLIQGIILDEAIHTNGKVSGASVGRRFASIASSDKSLVSGIVQSDSLQPKVPDQQTGDGIDNTIKLIEGTLTQQGQTDGQTLFQAAVEANNTYVPVDLGLPGASAAASDRQVAQVVGGGVLLRRAA